jgi:hypothetical protein
MSRDDVVLVVDKWDPRIVKIAPLGRNEIEKWRVLHIFLRFGLWNMLDEGSLRFIVGWAAAGTCSLGFSFGALNC